MKTWPSSSCGIGKQLCANANEGHNNNDRGEPRFALKHGPSVVNEGGNPPSLTTLLCVEVVVAPSAKG